MFINEFFDGVCVEIPSSVISLNSELKPILENLSKALENIKIMGHHPRVEKSVFELNNYEKKKEIKKEREERQAETKRKEDEKMRKYLSKEIIPIEFEIYRSATTEKTDLIFDDIEFDDISTRKGYIKAEVLKRFDEFKKDLTREKLLQFSRKNGIYLDEEMIIPEFFDKNKVSLFLDSYGNKGLRFEVARIKIYQHGKRKKDEIFFRLIFLSKDEIGFYTELIKIDDFEYNGNGKYYLKNYVLNDNQFEKNGNNKTKL